MAKTAGFILGFSPKVLVTLITMGVVVFVSISFNAYLLATKDSEPFKTEVEDLKNNRIKLEGENCHLRDDNTILKGEIRKLTLKISEDEKEKIKTSCNEDFFDNIFRGALDDKDLDLLFKLNQMEGKLKDEILNQAEKEEHKEFAVKLMETFKLCPNLDLNRIAEIAEDKGFNSDDFSLVKDSWNCMPLRELFNVYAKLDFYFGDFASFSEVDKDKIDDFFSLYPEVTDFRINSWKILYPLSQSF